RDRRAALLHRLGPVAGRGPSARDRARDRPRRLARAGALPHPRHSRQPARVPAGLRVPAERENGQAAREALYRLVRRILMPRQIVSSDKAPKPPATYSQAVKAAGLVFVSGTSPHDPATGTIKGTTIQEQTRQCLANIAAILEEAGSSLDKIVSITI